jgi:hypothetical protein
MSEADAAHSAYMLSMVGLTAMIACLLGALVIFCYFALHRRVVSQAASAIDDTDELP